MILSGEKQCDFDIHQPSPSTLQVALSGSWSCLVCSASANSAARILTNELQDSLNRSAIKEIEFDTSELLSWDSKLVITILELQRLAEAKEISFDLSGLPEGLRRLMRLATSVPRHNVPGTGPKNFGLLESVGLATVALKDQLLAFVMFLGESMLSLLRLLRGKAQYQRPDVWLMIQEAGPQALPIVGVVSILLGVILGFMGAEQFAQFGAEIYVADLVALGQTREIAPMMTAIVMTGRTGAAYAAQLGTMKVNEEIDALSTFGFTVMDFLVLPRMLALAIMMPFLVLYADVAGMVGGYIVGVGVLDLGTMEYISQTRDAINMSDIALGVIKGSVFGVLVAITGCMQGMQSGRSASAVGDAATSAVVSGIFAIITASAIFSVVTNFLAI